MADDKKEDLSDETVHVTVEPADESKTGRDKAGKVKEALKGNVKKAIEQKKGQGARKQLDAAEDEVDEAAKQVSPRVAKKIKVKVEGKEGENEVSREKTVKPKEGGK